MVVHHNVMKTEGQSFTRNVWGANANSIEAILPSEPMMRHALFCLIFCVLGMGLADAPFARAQVRTSPAAHAAKIEHKPITPTLLEQAQRAYRLGQFDAAVEHYRAIIALGSDKALAYAGLSRTYLKLNKLNDAYLAATKGVEDGALVAATHSALGEVYFRQGKLDEAQAEFLTALKLNPADSRSYLGLARLDQATYDFKKAKVAIDKAHSLDPADPDIEGAWVDTRSLVEQAKALEVNISSETGYYSRAAKVGLKQRLTVIKDQIGHPERTCEMVSRPEKAEMGLKRIGPKKEFVGLDVRVNGVAAPLVLSTSSSGIVINGKVAEKSGVRPIARTDLDALGEQNPPEAYVGFVRSLTIENIEFQNCYVTVVQETSPRSFYDQFEGLIAAGLFSDYLVDLDIRHAKLGLEPLPPRPDIGDQESVAMDLGDPDAKTFNDRYVAKQMAAWTRMYRFGSAILIPARVNDSPPNLFEVTTSSGLSVLAPEFAKEYAPLGRDKAPTHLEGINGKVGGVSTGRVKLEFAGLHFETIRMISFDETTPSDSPETEVSGYLGFEMFRNLRMLIDYRDGLIHFDKPKDLAMKQKL
jgi:tetratricopeptide (TPR) repeat protein